MSFRYTVTLTFTDPSIAVEWLAWMRDEHVAHVLQAGAQSAEIIKMDGVFVRCEARYSFASRAEFDRYVRDHAPRLREEGLRHFPTTRGIQYERSCGEVIVRA
ncbi:MAG: DUF4286 family protein [Planctomycetota bacterium]|nr:DUF4286 family protein [Planctomycetota bacterium]